MRLSVIIPAYNRAHLLAETLRSLLLQTQPADEIIVVDDGSTDGTASVAEGFGSRVKVLRQSNLGPAAARNAGFKVSRGEFIHFFDSDDIAAPNKHEVQMADLQRTGADIAYSPWVQGSFLGTRFCSENHVLQQKGLPHGNLIKALLTTWSIVPHACLFRRSIVDKSGGFPEHLWVAEDQLMFLNCLFKGARVVHSSHTLELYRTGDSAKITASGDGQKNHAHYWAMFLRDADVVCRRNEVDARRWFGFRFRAREALEDLRKFRIEDANLADCLKTIQGEQTPEFCYTLYRTFVRNWLGLKWRITGDRSADPFRAGPITARQIYVLQEIGYSFETSNYFSSADYKGTQERI